MYKNSQNKYWNSNNVAYKACSLREIIKINIASENNAINQYTRLIKYTNNMYLRRIYERILLDEKNHLEIFRILQGKIEKDC